MIVRRRPSARVAVVGMLVAAGAVLALGAVHVDRRHAIIRLGYELSETRAAQRVVDEEQRRLTLERSVLANPDRIEQLARSFGMIHPEPAQVRVVPALASRQRRVAAAAGEPPP